LEPRVPKTILKPCEKFGLIEPYSMAMGIAIEFLSKK